MTMMTARKTQKLWLVIKKDTLTDKIIENLKILSYDKIYVLSKQYQETHIHWKVTVVNYNNISTWIKKIYKLNTENIPLIPFFFWDGLAKNSIDIYNHTFSTQVKYSSFKDKDIINRTIQSASKKLFFHYTFHQLQKEKYENLIKKWLKKFIIKPKSWSSSLMTFLVEQAMDFDIIKKKILPEYTYIVEEYFDGELNSVDFYHDGKNLYILAYIKETALKDLSTTNFLSEHFLQTYKRDLKLFNFLIPIRYNESFKNISQEELYFLSKIKNILTDLQYKWCIHLEYKFDLSTHTIWFVEWWARLGFKRNAFIENVYTINTKVFDLPYLILQKKLQWFVKLSPWIYTLLETDTNTNILWMRTSFYKKTNKKFTTIEAFERMLSRFLRNYFSKTFDIHIIDIQYVIKYQKWNTFYPFYQRNDTRLDYLLYLTDKDFLIVKKYIGKIIEHLVFNDFTLK